MSTRLRASAWAMSILSKGSRWGPDGDRQRAGAGSVFNGDWKFLEALAGYNPGEVGSEQLGTRQFAEAMFGGDFPRRCRAYQFLVGWVENGVAHRLSQVAAVGKPPNQGMGRGVEQ